MNKLIARMPINTTSIGNVSVNILRELFKKQFEVSIFPHQEPIDLSVFDKLSSDFVSWIESGIIDRNKMVEKDIPTLQVWNLRGSIERLSSKSFLYSFYELDSPTSTEINICRSHDKVIFSSSDASEIFNKSGAINTAFAPLGFDRDFFETGKQYLKNTTHFGLMGKLEKRKHTLKILKLWAEHFGNLPQYELSCAITNKFLSMEDMNKLINHTLEGKYYENINFIPFMNSNSEMNEFMNAIDIDLTGLSGGEGWNLPAFNSTCLGKWSCVLNATSHKDWATNENAILVNPSGKEPAYDGLFFLEGQDTNQGNINTFTESSFTEVTSKAIEASKQKNIKGVELKNKFTYEKSVDNILSHIF